MKADLHTHTTHSDGTLSPRELVACAKSKGLSCIAITDHDTVSGISEGKAGGNDEGIEVVSGVEVSVMFEGGTMHILGHFLNADDRDLLKKLSGVQEARRERNPKMIQRLNELGFELCMEDVEKIAGGRQVGRPHVASAMVKKGYAKDRQEAFDKYLGKGRPAYIEKRKMTSEEAIGMIRKAKGTASLAHPAYLNLGSREAFETVLRRLADEGLQGIEAYSSHHSGEEAEDYERVAKRFGLVATGGSDFHGGNKPNAELGVMAGGKSLDYKTVQLLRKRIR